MKNFWRELQKPFFVLAPLEDVTDSAFRAVIARYGKPDVMFTEFTSADGLIFADEVGQRKLRAKLVFGERERPIVAQLFSAVPERMEQAAQLAASLGFDGIDINMGCPDRSVEKQGAGAALIKNPELAQEIIAAAKRGAGDLPVSVKTRIGYNTDELDAWVPALLSTDIAALTIHGRTRKEMSNVPVHVDAFTRTVALRDASGKDTLIIANGDVQSVAHAREITEETGCDGVMMGRAIFGNPWLFSEHEATKEERIAALREHITTYDEHLGDIKTFAVMKKHFKSYISGWDGAKELRMQLMETKTAEKAIALLRADSLEI